MTTTTFDPRLLRLVRRRLPGKSSAKIATKATGEAAAKATTGAGRSNSMFVGLAFLIAVLYLLGLVMVLSASSYMALNNYGNSWYHVTRQATWGLVGVVVMVIVARTDYHRWRRHAGPMLWVSLFLLVAVLVVGTSHNGSRRWVGYGALVIQPTELVKLTFLLWTADLLARRAKWMHKTEATLRPVMVALAVIGVLVMLQPNLGTTIVLAGIALAVCFVAGVRLGPVALWGSIGIVVITLLAIIEPYRRARMLSFLNPMADPRGEGYQTAQSLVGLASGGFSGTGLGASRAKFGFLPYAHSDFIFAIIGEELGLVGALVVLALFVLLGVLGIRVALHAPDRFGMLLAVGVTSWFLFQAFVNVGVVAGVLPVTGVPLPFVSYGGSSLVFSMAGAGLLLAVARHAATPGKRADMTPEPLEKARP
jgi:cell division protein FtsW